MTLIEIIISIAILSFIVVVAASLFGTSNAIIRNNAKDKTGINHAISGVENVMGNYTPNSTTSTVTQQNGDFSVNFQGTDVKVSGSFINGTDENNENELRFFKPNVG